MENRPILKSYSMNKHSQRPANAHIKILLLCTYHWDTRGPNTRILREFQNAKKKKPPSQTYIFQFSNVAVSLAKEITLHFDVKFKLRCKIQLLFTCSKWKTIKSNCNCNKVNIKWILVFNIAIDPLPISLSLSLQFIQIQTIQNAATQ